MLKINDIDDFFSQTYLCLMEKDPIQKVKSVYTFFQYTKDNGVTLCNSTPPETEVRAGLPFELKLVSPKGVPRRRLHSPQGKPAMLHAIAHIEFNAINLALDAMYRFRDLPVDYYVDWLNVACEEAYHFHLLSQHLHSYGVKYGDFPAHNGLWEMAQKTSYDVLARMALVPRVMEARGLDVTPEIAKRFRSANDPIASDILGIIFQDEINHVKVGNRWYYAFCEERKIDPTEKFIALLKEHAPDFLRGPFARDVRRKAGFRENELEILNEVRSFLECD